MAAKKKVHILGGGMSSLVTAFALTDIANWKDTYDSITVYQQGWRLGGKGASGRNADKDHRIEEHGLHVLFGCYENTFKLMRRCYEALGQGWHWPFPPWEFADAFKGEPQSTLISMQEYIGGEWRRWDVEAPNLGGAPGLDDPVVFAPGAGLRLLYGWALDQGRRWQEEIDREIGPASRAPEERVPNELLEKALVQLDAIVDPTSGEIPLGLRSASPRSAATDSMTQDTQKFLDWMSQARVFNDIVRRAKIVAEFTLCTAKGLIADQVIEGKGDWFKLDGLDIAAWLAKHGASEATRTSAIVNGLRDAVFSWNTAVGAGTILHALMRAGSYKGSVLYRMQAGMGDTIFAPLYHVLKERGVHFEFFHQVQKLTLSTDRTRLAAIVFDRQVRLKGTSYQPLVPIKNELPCWPSRPDKNQLHPDDAPAAVNHDLENWWDPWRGTPETLVLGADDIVVLGISVGAFPDICDELMRNPKYPAFEEMVMSVATTQTQAVQLWIREKRAGMGWKGHLPIVIPFAEPFDTWADMSHLSIREDLPKEVLNVSYLCSSIDDDEAIPPRSDHKYPERQRARVLLNARRWLNDSSQHLWPKTREGNHFRWSLLQKWTATNDDDALADQHYCATVNPSDRYVRVVPGSNAKRLRADESGYDNLFLTGDWTKTAMSAGCLEGATMAGLQTARCIDPRVPKALHDWLPDGPKRNRIAGARSYTRRDGDLLVVPPVGLNVRMRTFVLRADPAVLRELCRNELNLGAGCAYRPAGPFVVLYASSMDHQVAAGTIGGSEIGIWVPVIASDNAGHDRQMLTYTPYLWVDSSAAMAGGRAVYGFPKHMGRLTIPSWNDPNARAEFGVDAEVLRVPQGRAEWVRLITAKRTDNPQIGANSPWTLAQIKAMLDLMLGTAGNFGTPTGDMVCQLLRPTAGMPMVFLKEFPEIDGSWDAPYQAVAEAPIEIIGNNQSGSLAGDYVVEFSRTWSHHVWQRLGITPGTHDDGHGNEVEYVNALLCAWMQFDSQVKPGRIIWKA